jgi:hypothetical protein
MLEQTPATPVPEQASETAQPSQPAPLAEAQAPNAPTPVSTPVDTRIDNFRQTDPYSAAWPEGTEPVGEVAFMPSASMALSKKAIADTPSSPLGDNKKSQEWVGTLNSGLANLAYADGLTSTVKREDAVFEQKVTSPEGPLTGLTPPLKMREGIRYTGESARLRIRSALNMGTLFSLPLWHSGFWITLKAPSEGALLELFRRIDTEKVTLGRASYGLMFSNGSSYTTKLLLDFILDHQYETSVKLKEGEDLRSLIRVPDLSLLIWGIACAIWPSGFAYQRSCIANPDKCKHVIREKLNLTKLLMTDTTALTQRQISHMTKRQRGSVDSDDVGRYVSEFIRGQKCKVALTEELSVVLRVPTAAEHIDAGYRWINAIEETYGASMTQAEGTRNDYLISQGKATVMRQYAHFVQGIEVAGELYDELEDIEEVLNELTANDAIRNTFLDKTAVFLDDSIVSLVAIPTFKCPNCAGEQHSHKEMARYPSLIPLDVSQTFFTLLVQRLMKIEER